MDNQFDLALFKAWASLGHRLRADQEKRGAERKRLSWPLIVIKGLITATRNLDDEYFKVVDRSRELLSPFGEPLELDFGLNRWLRGQREEAYSDWLAWLFSRLQANELIELLAIPPAHPVGKLIAAHPNDQVSVRCEVVVDKGHDEATGRLDLELKITDSALVVIEVKKGGAHSSDTRKQLGYIASLRDRKIQFYPILLVTDSAEAEIDGFFVLRYADFCLRLRRFVARRIHDRRGYVFTSFLLALAATIESNFMNLVISGGRPTFATISHLNRFMEICR